MIERVIAPHDRDVNSFRKQNTKKYKQAKTRS